MKKKIYFVLGALLAIFPAVSFAFTITDDTLGGDCPSIGVWDSSTKTCTLTRNLSETVEIMSDNIVLDGNGHSVSTTSPSGVGIGVKAVGRDNINIRNLTLSGWVQGIVIDSSRGALVENNTLRDNDTALQAGYTIYGPASNRIIRNNVFESNFYAVYLSAAQGDLVEGNTITTDGDPNSIGIVLLANNSIPIVIQENIVAGPGYAGIFSSDADFNDFLGNTVEGFTYGFYITYCSSPKNVNGNTIRDNSVGIHIEGGDISQLIHNSFIGNSTHTTTAFLPFGCGRGIIYELSRPLPEGGNYWDTYDTPAEGCVDTNGDGVCDAPYRVTTTTDGFGQGVVDIFDDLPWTRENGWEESPPPQLDVLYIEVNQAVQRIDPDSLANEVPLVAGKDTIVRAYVSNQEISQPNPSNVTGALYRSPPGQNLWSQIGMLDSPFITAVPDDPATLVVEPTPEMLASTLNFRLPGGLQEGDYELKVEVRLGSNPTTVAMKTTTIEVQKRKTFRILYTKVNYAGELPAGNFADAYGLLKGVYPIQFAPDQWVADTTSFTYNGVRPTVGCANSIVALNLLRKLDSRRTEYNRNQPPEAKVDFIVGIVASSRLNEGVEGCSNKYMFNKYMFRNKAAFVTDKDTVIRAAVAHEIGHLNDLPIPGRRPEETEVGYPIDEGFKVPTDRKHFFDFNNPNTVTSRHRRFTNFMGPDDQIPSTGCCNWVDEKTYDFLFQRLNP